jgi:hypothetical protein
VTPSTAQSKSALQNGAQQWKDYQLRLIEQRLTVVLTSMANLKVEQAQLMAQKERIINPPPPPLPTSIEEKRLKHNARQREYWAKRRADGKPFKPKDREKYNTYHREYERKKRARLRAEKQKLSMEEILQPNSTKRHASQPNL